MEAPRSWQFDLSNWSVTRKVGIVLVLPVLLATVFAVLRINNELRALEMLGAATEQAEILGPLVRYGTATEQFALASAAARTAAANPQTDAALTAFNSALADLENALGEAEVRDEVNTEIAAAVALGTTMRNSLRNGSPAMVGDHADEIAVRLGNALALSPTVEDLDIQRYFQQLTTLRNARRQLIAQQMVINSPDAASNPTMRARVLTAGGAELTMVFQYGQIRPDVSENTRTLLDAVQTRLAAFGQNTPDPASDPAVRDSLRISTDTYNATTDHLAQLIDVSLYNSTIAARNSALREAALVIAVLLAGLALALSVARTLVVPVRRLRRDALEVAHVKLPNELAVVRSGGATPEVEPVDVQGDDEIGQLARAVDEIHEQALELAAEQARLRLQIGNMFETLSRRSQTLVEQQLALIEELEHDEDNPGRLQSLFRLDHLATRMRRNGDNLLVLAGTALRRGALAPVPLTDMLWSAVSQVEDYQRVEIGNVPDGVVAGEVAVDIEHLLAELIDNALRYSPPTAPVAVTVSRAVDGGYLIEVTDRGLGMSAEDLQATNARLASGGQIDIETARRMGLFVVGRLAKRHSITVGLRRTSIMVQQPGITATVHLPGALVAPDEDGAAGGPPPTPGSALGAAFELPAAAQRALALVPDPPGSTSRPPAQPARFTEPLLPHSESFRADRPTLVGSGPDRSAFGTGEFALPQRRPANRSTETPEPAASFGLSPGNRPADSPLTGGARSEATGGPLARDGYGTAGTGSAFQNGSGLPIRRRPDSDSPAFSAFGGSDTTVGTGESFDEDPEEPTGLWSEAYKTQSYPAPTFEPEAEPDTGRAGMTTSTPRSEWSLPSRTAPSAATPGPSTRRSGFDRNEPNTGVERKPPGPNPTTTGANRLQPVTGESPTPIYQRMVSEWLVEPAATDTPNRSWSSPGDDGWLAAEDAATPTPTSRTVSGLPIRQPGAQLVPGGLAPVEEDAPRNPEEIRNSLTRHLSGVRSGRANAQNNDGGLA
ncbi:sensor histidine kinase [Nocardia brevicatena]|uniref:sensor histidine kinase n=1 Tax=Nocardia brevicatena TaxID=37327 RepID=UPI00031EA9DD|nr:ATP-binding protein [Nocardia brevicatena]